MLVELCARNYATHDGLVNGADGLFKTFILIIFQNIYFHRILKHKNWIFNMLSKCSFI
jgi:hypothetical protein